MYNKNNGIIWKFDDLGNNQFNFNFDYFMKI